MTIVIHADIVLARNAMCDAFVDAIDGGAGKGILELYDDTTKLVTLTFATTSFGAAASGTATAAAITQGTAIATGTADIFKIHTTTDDTTTDDQVCTGSVGTGAGDINFSGSALVTTNDIITCSSLTFTQPDGS